MDFASIAYCYCKSNYTHKRSTEQPMMIAYTLLLFPLLTVVSSLVHPPPLPPHGPLSDPNHDNLFDHHHHQTPPNTDNIDIDYSYDMSSFQGSDSDGDVSDTSASTADGKQTDSLLDDNDSDVLLPTTIINGKEETKDSGSLRGRQLPHMVTYDNIKYDAHEKDNLFIDGGELYQSKTGENSGIVPAPSPSVIGDESTNIATPTTTQVVDTSPTGEHYPGKEQSTPPPTTTLKLTPRPTTR